MADINFDFTTGSLPGAITFTRASIGTYLNNVGTLITASSNVARFNYVSGVANLLIEPAATNLLLQSNAFTTTWFQINSAVLTAAQFVSPDGTNNGWSITSGAGFGADGQNLTFSNVPYTMSVWAKLIVGTSAPIKFQLNAAASADQVLTTTIARVNATLTPAAGASSAYIFVNNVAGNTDGIYGAQLETGSKMTSYIPTTTGTVTRAADSATFTIPSGVTQLTYTFDDNSTQIVAVAAGSYTIPTNLNRANIKTIVGLGGTPTVVTPTANRVAGTYVDNVIVTLSCATPGATMCYRTDGVDPTATTPGTCSGGSTPYTGPITISSTTTLKVIGSLAGNTNSAVLTVVYTIRAANTYYVSASGNNANSGLTTALPWAHAPGMNAATGVAASTVLLPGDIVLLKRGDTWTSTKLTVNAGGEMGKPITLGAYGTGANPIISSIVNVAAITAVAADRGYWTIDGLDLRASGIVPGLDMPLSIYHDYWSGEMLPQPGWVIQNCLANAAFYLSGPNTVVRSCVINGLANSKPRWAGLVFRSPVNTDGIVEYCDISNFTDRGIWFFYSADRGVVRYNTVHDIVAGSDNPGTCINMDGFGTPVVDAQVYGNLCHTSPRGIEFENGTRGKAYFNLVRDCTVSGISVINYDAFVTQPSNIEISYNLIRNTNIGINLNYVQTIKFIHNTIAVPTGANSQGFCIQSVDTTVSGITFTNNIIAGAWTNPIRAQTGKNVWAQFDYNDIMPAASSLIYFQFGTGTNWTLAQVQSNLGAMTHGITGDPQFVSGSDFSLQSGSPAKGTGLDLGTTYNQGLLPTTVWPDDIDVGTQAGGAWNMGAYLQPAPVIPPIGPSEGNIAWIQSGGKGELKVADLSKSRITTVTSATLKGTPGQFYGCIIGAMAANGVIEVYDALTVTGTPVLVLTSPATLTQSQGVFALPHPIRMAIGITVRTITAAQDVTMLWN